MHRFTLRSVIVPVLCAVALIACSEKAVSDRDLQIISLTEAQSLVAAGEKGFLGLGETSGGVWLDPRSEAAFREAHIPGAINIPAQFVRERHEKLKDHGAIVVYGEGYRDPKAEATAKTLIELGHDNVRVLQGGLRAWRDAGYELGTGVN